MKWWWLCLLILLCACSGKPRVVIYEVEDAVLPGDSKPRVTATAEETVADDNDSGTVAERVFENEAVTITGAEGLEIKGTLSYSQGFLGERGVILLHMLGSERTAWDELVGRLLPAGYTVLAIDMRGHGETGATPDWVLAAEDLKLVWDYLRQRPEVDPARIGIVGASIGANMALRTAVNVPEIDTAVLLSPGLTYGGVTTDDVVGQMGERPLLIVASEGDRYAADSSRTLAEMGPTITLEIYEGSSHGTSMLAAEPDLVWVIINWLDGRLQ